jgi:hypothetical protein
VRLPEPAFVIVMAAPFVGSKCTVCDSGTPRCDGHHEMSIFRARGGEANSVPATGDDSSAKFTNIFASWIV